MPFPSSSMVPKLVTITQYARRNLQPDACIWRKLRKNIWDWNQWLITCLGQFTWKQILMTVPVTPSKPMMEKWAVQILRMVEVNTVIDLICIFFYRFVKL
jgi:hypothetical protein